ncbi:MAG: twin-arginine translocase TatA/TatE family subunit [Bdellovibrionales bacterium]|nr:twin-arginine translocase TatA/TatE family subunit [Bdellovibrionales bacterium]
MLGLGTTELIIILVIVVIIFGGKRIPEIFAGLGKGIRSFKKGMNEDEEDSQSESSEKG